jgi:alkanesulfonate monooxygenase SsuD/methylene tetrahydromethanopterin reductase-like flavin-dependent oxidoreductase (luciferase family)
LKPKFSTFTLSQVENPERTAQTLDGQFEQFLLAEELGFSTVWIAEHLFSNLGSYGSSQVLAAAIAKRTEKIRIGSAVSIVPFNHPLRTASDFAAVDSLSRGRLNYGVARGYQPSEFLALGLDFSKSREMFEEGLNIILEAWKGEAFTYEGKYWKIPKAVKVYPPLVQKPRPPIWLAAQTRDSFIEAGRRGFNVLMSATFTYRASLGAWIDELEKNLEEYDRACRGAGHDPKTMERGLSIAFHVAERADEAEKNYAPHIQWSFTGNAARRAEAGTQVNTFNYDEIKAASGVIVGDVDESIRQLRMLKRRLGLTEIILEFNKGGIAHEKVTRSMRLFMESVAPLVDGFIDRGESRSSNLSPAV